MKGKTMNNRNSTSYRSAIAEALEPIERGSAKFDELVLAIMNRNNSQGWLDLLERDDTTAHDLGELYYMMCFQRAEFVGERPAWADPADTDFCTEGGTHLPKAEWMRHFEVDDDVKLAVSRADVYDPDSGVTIIGDVEWSLLLPEEVLTVGGADRVRKLVAGMLNAVDEFEATTD